MESRSISHASSSSVVHAGAVQRQQDAASNSLETKNALVKCTKLFKKLQIRKNHSSPHSRVADHKFVSSRTNKNLPRLSNSRMREYAEETNHDLVFNHSSVLRR